MRTARQVPSVRMPLKDRISSGLCGAVARRNEQLKIKISKWIETSVGDDMTNMTTQLFPHPVGFFFW